MQQLSQKQQKILSILVKNGKMSSSAIREALLKAKENVALITVKRALSEMVDAGVIIEAGGGRSTVYGIGIPGRVFFDIDARDYCAVEPDWRYGLSRYNFDLFAKMPTEVFYDEERARLEAATKTYKQRSQNVTPVTQKKELERLIIELSWKSSKIEGNTYTLLETEKLILENKKAVGRSENETQMILNHKDAFDFVRQNQQEFKKISRANLEKLHSILVKDMEVGFGLRKAPVGITGTKYQPLDNIYQVEEAVKTLSAAADRMENIFAKSLLAVLGISYVQPFEDGNKRTGRLMANALLLSHSLAPLSYRSVDETDYRQATIVFYELNSMIPFKEIFIGQCEFAANNYALGL
ncbi:MAG: Fic family protein [Candidatus Nealsonbacteria bacterium DGGOD1a]|nr:MAG: Fic family protein [Candidatus Nealsonbacteria bacterium DGGOD1a]